MKKILAIAFILLFGVSSLFAQKSLWSISWNTAAPLGESKDYVNPYSFRGFGINGTGFVTDEIALGVNWGWNTFYEELGRQTVEVTNGHLTAAQYRTLNAMPLYMTGHYIFEEDAGHVSPYLGVGIGTMYQKKSTEVGQLLIEEKGWQFAFAPEIGIYIFNSSGTGFKAAFVYNYGVKSSKVPAISYMGINIGIGWMSGYYR